MLAGLFDSLQALQWMYLMAHRDPDRPAPEQPTPLPRPGDAAEPQDNPASRYDTSNVPAIAPGELPAWLA